jgi:hypothetical protein
LERERIERERIGREQHDQYYRTSEIEASGNFERNEGGEHEDDRTCENESHDHTEGNDCGGDYAENE